MRITAKGQSRFHKRSASGRGWRPGRGSRLRGFERVEATEEDKVWSYRGAAARTPSGGLLTASERRE